MEIVLGSARALRQLREDFARLDREVHELAKKLEIALATQPAAHAALLNASDQLKRMAARAERSKVRADVDPELDEEDREINELWQEVHRR